MENNRSSALTAYGWNDAWDSAWRDNPHCGNAAYEPARVVAQYSKQYKIMTAGGEKIAAVSGKYAFEAGGRSDFPAVGDFVAAQPLEGEQRAVIHSLLPRLSAMTRKEAGNVVDEQVIAANIDTMFITNALNQDFNIRRIERYLIAVWESGARPVVLLTKADLCDDAEEKVSAVQDIAPGVPVHAVSAHKNQGKEALAPYLRPGRTVAVAGMSGVGKSTLLNWLAEDDLQQVHGIRESDSRGRHTTTHRELFFLPSGAIMIDTPGMRELQLWDAADGWETTFSDIAELAANCRFHDCSHESEAGCAVKEALESGALDARRYGNYKKTERELAHLARKEQAHLRKNEKRAGKQSGAKAGRNARDGKRVRLLELE
ncbi:ribosome small subunit-dependent GTPase A [Paenibacillus arenilitoris]|uniref:ribosome small subunit-dependent GTPase A n=1 Tax=Paenibacillus arenilitoris TaxID=2772299 RepID=UPI001CC229AD|nr:ribosome small subunit-dependent GTPase A [Paenibacillus arenilitoris]